jgi:hypothetical protein
MANVLASVANAVASAVANEVGASGAVAANEVAASATPTVFSASAEKNDTILIKKWHLASNGNITTWVPHNKHNSLTFKALNACYTGHTNGYSTGNGIMIDYEYTIPLTQLKKRKVKWQWQGLYTNKNDKDIIIEFNIEEHVQEDLHSKPDQQQTLKEITDIINKLNEPIQQKYQPHNFRLSEGIVLCQHCGEFLTDLKKANLPSCIITNQPL